MNAHPSFSRMFSSQEFVESEIDAVWISNADNIGYATGFWGSFARMLLCKNGTTILFSDPRYTLMAQELCMQKHIDYREISREKDFFSNLLEEFSIDTLGIEGEETSILAYKQLEKSCGKKKCIPLKKTLEYERIIKSTHEQKILQEATYRGEQCLHKTLQYIHEGVSEKEIAWIFEKTAKEELGIEALSFTPIVSFGENSALPHCFPSEKKLEKNMPILIDCGVMYRHYASDLTRCFWFGERAGSNFLEWESAYQKVCKAQQEGIKHMTHQTPVSRADISARTVLGTDEQYFQYSFGHGVGVNVHESPTVSSHNTHQTFQNGMVITAEPGIHFPSKFGIRIEDMVCISDDTPQVLNTFPKGTPESFLLS